MQEGDAHIRDIASQAAEAFKRGDCQEVWDLLRTAIAQRPNIPAKMEGGRPKLMSRETVVYLFYKAGVIWSDVKKSSDGQTMSSIMAAKCSDYEFSLVAQG